MRLAEQCTGRRPPQRARRHISGALLSRTSIPDEGDNTHIAKPYQRVMAPEPASDHGERHVCRPDRRIHRLGAQWMGWRGGRGDGRLGCRRPDRGPLAAHRAWDITRASNAQGSAIPSAIRSARGRLAAAGPAAVVGAWQPAVADPATAPPVQVALDEPEPTPTVPDHGTQEQVPAGSKRPGRRARAAKSNRTAAAPSSIGKSGSEPARRSESGRQKRAVEAVAPAAARNQARVATHQPASEPA